LRRAAAALRLSRTAYDRALVLAGIAPTRTDWVRGIDRFLLLFGALAMLAGIAAFFAYNWAGLHKFAKFALIEGAIVVAVAATARRGIDSAAGRATLFAAAFLVGVLFAVYGQIYQTGADPFGLFLVWALLIAGWAGVGRQAGIWMLMLVLANLSLILYWTQVLRPSGLSSLGGLFGPLASLVGAVTDGGLATLVFVLNALALVAWELRAQRSVAWMVGRWWPRIVALAALAVVVSGTLFYIFNVRFGARDDWLVLSGPVFFVGFAALSLWYYQRRVLDLFILAATLLGGIMIFTAWVGVTVGEGSLNIALLLAILVIGQTAGAAVWLRKVAERPRTA
jgi:uncharacterized membrane protein